MTEDRLEIRRSISGPPLLRAGQVIDMSAYHDPVAGFQGLSGGFTVGL